MTQPRLFDIAPADDLRCSAGYPWEAYHLRSGVRCPGCQAIADESERQFCEAVARGTYDERGYTPAEAKQRDEREAARMKVPA
jgi:hypothetical protein